MSETLLAFTYKGPALVVSEELGIVQRGFFGEPKLGHLNPSLLRNPSPPTGLSARNVDPGRTQQYYPGEGKSRVERETLMVVGGCCDERLFATLLWSMIREILCLLTTSSSFLKGWRAKIEELRPEPWGGHDDSDSDVSANASLP